MHVSAILPAAGLGTRMGLPHPEKARENRKQFIELDGAPVLLHTLRKFDLSPVITDITIAVRPEDREWVAALVAQHRFSKPVHIVDGGETRQESVSNALSSLADSVDLVAVHDAVRPLIELDQIERVVNAAAETGGAIVGIVPVDTVKQIHLGKIRATIPRERLILAQTPQVFRRDLLKRAVQKAREDNFTGTDESSLVERLEEIEVSVVPGSERNLKITRPTDLALARYFLSEESK